MTIALLMALAAASATAERPKSDLSVKETRQVAQKFAHCVFGKKAKVVRKVIMADLTNGEIIRDNADLIDGQCLNVATPTAGMEMRMPGETFRYALADAAFAKDFATGLPAIAAAPPLRHRDYLAEFEASQAKTTAKRKKPLKPAQIEELEKDRREARSYAYLSRFGECAVRSNPAGITALLRSQAATPAESAAFAALQTAFNACVEEGSTFEADKTILRGTIALNAYRLASAAAPVLAEGKR